MKNKNKNLNRISGASILLLIVLIVFIQRVNLTWLKNWWALLFLIPAIGSMNNLYVELKNKRGFSFSLASNLMGIIFPIVISVIFLFNLQWNLTLPIIIVLAGLALFVLGYVNDEKGAGKILLQLKYWFFSWGLAVVIVGVITFLSTIQSNFTNQQINTWYGGAVIVAALGGLVSGFILFRKEGRFSLLSTIHIVTALLISIPAIFVLIP